MAQNIGLGGYSGMDGEWASVLRMLTCIVQQPEKHAAEVEQLLELLAPLWGVGRRSPKHDMGCDPGANSGARRHGSGQLVLDDEVAEVAVQVPTQFLSRVLYTNPVCLLSTWSLAEGSTVAALPWARAGGQLRMTETGASEEWLRSPAGGVPRDLAGFSPKHARMSTCNIMGHNPGNGGTSTAQRQQPENAGLSRAAKHAASAPNICPPPGHAQKCTPDMPHTSSVPTFGAKLAPIRPNSATSGQIRFVSAHFAQCCAGVVVWYNKKHICPMWAKSGPSLAASAKFCPGGQNRPNSPEVGKNRPNSARSGRIWTNWGKFRPQSRHGTCLGHIWGTFLHKSRRGGACWASCLAAKPKPAFFG